MPDPEYKDNPTQRAEVDLRLTALRQRAFSGLLDDSIQHAAATAADPAAQPWVPMGPRNIGGRIRCMAMDPKNPNTVYAGAAFGGVWKTENGGDTWFPCDNFTQPAPAVALRQALPIGAIGVARANPRILYVGTGEPVVTSSDFDMYPGSGLYRSNDGGATFVQIDHVQTGLIQAHRYEAILVDPWEDDRCWIASTQGLWRQEPGTPPVLAPDVITGASATAAPQDVSDIAIDFGDVTAGNPPPTFTVYAAIRGVGIFTAVFNRGTKRYVGEPNAWVFLDTGINEPTRARIKIALAPSNPDILYAIFSHSDRTTSEVYRTADRGVHWEVTGTRADTDDQGNYDLVLTVHPERPDIVFCGTVDMYRTKDAGRSWNKAIDWTRYDAGDRAQHADQHGVLFDPLNPRKVWVSNDGGISVSYNMGETWRKRSHGILAGQFYDITTHPAFPFVTGGGLQDNGSWVSFGGPTWFHLFGADGGAMGFDPASLAVIYLTWQTRVEQINFLNPQVVPGSAGVPDYLNRMPDVPIPAPLPASQVPIVMQSNFTSLTANFGAGNGATFIGVLEHSPVVANHLLVGRKLDGFVGTQVGGAIVFNPAGFGPLPAGEEVSAVSYSPSDGANQLWWFGTNQGNIFRTPDGGGTWPAVALPNVGTLVISDIVVHPTNPAIVAVSTGGSPGRLYLTGDSGATWIEVSGRSAVAGAPPGPNSPAADQLSPSPIVCLCWDPQSPAAGGSDQILFVGTLAGVYVCRNLRAPTVWPPPAPPPTFPNPQWRTYNQNLPLVGIQDIGPVVVRDGGGVIVRTMLRMATFGRGAYEVQLHPTGADPRARPAVRLLIRNNIIDDGFDYSGTPAALANDPRFVAATPLAVNRAFDIRIDAPPFSFFEETLDGVEFDEDLRNDLPLAGQRNLVYVQVHTTGHQAPVDNVQVHLFFTDTSGGAAPPPLDADFWTNFPNAPSAGRVWQRVAEPQTFNGLGPAQPVVKRFEWIVPLIDNPTPQAALLAVCTHASDDVKASGPPLDIPTLRADRRVAVFVTDIGRQDPDIFLRDGTDASGDLGGVAWGGRAPDISVNFVEVEPDTILTDLGDLHEDESVLADTENFIYVRVFNRRDVPVTADVEVFLIPNDTPHDPDTWEKLGDTEAENIPPRGWKFAAPVLWNNPPDPLSLAVDPSEYRTVLLAAIITTPGDTVSPSPRDAINDLESFWKFFQGSNNAALRGLKYVR